MRAACHLPNAASSLTSVNRSVAKLAAPASGGKGINGQQEDGRARALARDGRAECLGPARSRKEGGWWDELPRKSNQKW